MHRVAEDKAVLDPALAQTRLHVGGDVDESAAGRDVEPEFFAVAFHGGHDSVYARKATDMGEHAS